MSNNRLSNYFVYDRLESQTEEENIEDLVTARFTHPEMIANPDSSSGSSSRPEVLSEKMNIPIRSPDDEFVEAYDEVRNKIWIFFYFLLIQK